MCVQSRLPGGAGQGSPATALPPQAQHQPGKRSQQHLSAHRVFLPGLGASLLASAPVFGFHEGRWLLFEFSTSERGVLVLFTARTQTFKPQFKPLFHSSKSAAADTAV